MANMHNINETLEEGIGKVRGRVEEARERIEGIAEEARERGEEVWSDVRRFARRHPGQTLAAAALLGVAIGALLVGRRRD